MEMLAVPRGQRSTESLREEMSTNSRRKRSKRGRKTKTRAQEEMPAASSKGQLQNPKMFKVKSEAKVTIKFKLDAQSVFEQSEPVTLQTLTSTREGNAAG